MGSGSKKETKLVYVAEESDDISLVGSHPGSILNPKT